MTRHSLPSLLLSTAVLAWIFTATAAQAQTLWFDANAGASNTSLGTATNTTYTWAIATNGNPTSVWNTSTGGAKATETAWVAGRVAAFNVGTATYTVNATSAITFAGLDVMAGNVTVGVSGGSTALSADGSFNAAASSSLALTSVLSGAFSLGINSSTTNVASPQGTVTLSGANTFGGAGASATLAAGTLNINHAQALGNASNTFIISGGTINNTSGASITTSNYSQTWNGDFAFTGTNALNLGTGAVTLGGNRQVTVSASTLTIGGAIGDGGNARSLTKLGNGELLLSGQSTYTGGTTVSAGTMTLGGSGTLGSGALAVNGTLNIKGTNSQTATTLSGSGTIDFGTTSNRLSLTTVGGQTFSGVMTGSGGFTVSGGSMLTLSGANSYTGTTQITGGKVAFGANNVLPTTSAGTITLSGGSTLSLAGYSQSTATGGLIVGSGGAYLDFGSLASSNQIQFGTTNLSSWSGTPLVVQNYNQSTDQLKFGTTTLDNSQVASLIRFDIGGTLYAGMSAGNGVVDVNMASAIPEPSTYAALSGLGVLGYGMYRRRRRQPSAGTAPAPAA